MVWEIDPETLDRFRCDGAVDARAFNLRWPTLFEFLQTYWDDLINLVNAVAYQASYLVWTWLNPMIESFKSAIWGHFDWLWQAFINTLAGVQAVILAAIPDVWAPVEYWVRWVLGELGKVLSPIGAAIEAGFAWLQQRIADIGTGVGVTIQEWVKAITNGLSASFDWVTVEVGRMFGTLGSTIEQHFATAAKEEAIHFDAQYTHTDEVAGFLGINILGGVGDIVSGVWEDMAQWLTSIPELWMTFLRRTPVEHAAVGLGWAAEWVVDVSQAFYDTLLSWAQNLGLVTPDNAPTVAGKLVTVAAVTVGGLAAMTLGGELMHPLKELGFGHVAAMIGDVVNYRLISAGIVAALVGAAISTPMRYYANNLLRPWIPMLPDLELMYAKKEIPFDAGEGGLGLKQALGYHGFSDDWINVFKEHLWNDPRLTEVIRIGQFFSPELVEGLRLPDAETAAWMRRANLNEDYINSSDWYFAWRAAKAGYDPRDVPILVETAKRATARREQTLFLDAATRLRRDGYITAERLLELVDKAWKMANPIDARMDATGLQVEAHVKSATTSMVLAAMTHGLLSRQEARDQLTGLGMDPARAELRIVSATVGLLPRVSIEVIGAGGVLEDYDLETL